MFRTRLRHPTPGGRPTARRVGVDDRSECPARPSILRLRGGAGGALHGAHDFNMGATSAQMMAQRFQHVGLGRFPVVHQQRLGRHDHAIEAVAALRGLFPDEGVLHGVGMIARAESLERQNVAPDAAADRDHAGACGHAIDDHGAGAAFAEPAAEFRPVQFKIVAQHIEQRGIRCGGDVMNPAVDGQANRGLRHAPAPWCAANFAHRPPERYRLHTNVQARHARPARRRGNRHVAARFLHGAGRQIRACPASFQPRSRLTAFRPARKIVRVRTKSPVALPRGKFPRSPTCGGFAAQRSALRRLVSSLMLTDTTAVTAAGNADKIRCDACPVMCYIKPGAAGACDRYANHDGELVRVDPHIVLERTVSHGGRLVPFQAGGDWDGKLVHEPSVFVTAIGAGTTYPDYKPAPFIVSSEVDGVDMVTVVTEGIFSYCGVKVKIDTDRYLGSETAAVRADGEAIGHVMTSEYGSQMLSLGGVHHLTGGSKKEGRVTCDALMDLSNCKPVELTIDGGATVVVQAGYPPIVNGVAEERMRVGCGSATIGMFAKQWHGKVDEVVVVDDHITGVLSEHQAGKLLDIPDTGIKMK